MEKTSLVLYGKEFEASLKLDYFMCGAAGALFAYIGQTYTPHKLDFWYYWLMPSVLGFLTLSFGCGLRKLRLDCMGMESNRRAHFATEETKFYFDAIQGYGQNPPKILHDTQANKPWTVDELEQNRQKSSVEAQTLKSKSDKLGEKAVWHGRLRTYFLIAGFVLILASKILQPYYAK